MNKSTIAHIKLDIHFLAERGNSLKNNLLKGTLILTVAGVLTRILGFFYRIYLSNTIGAEGLGIYQLIFPIYAICFTLYASGLQTAISQVISSEKASKKSILTTMTLSLIVSFSLSIFLYNSAEWISIHYLGAPQCKELLRILSLIFPFCGITSVINGAFYGLNKAGVPAATQLIEQVVRIGFVFFMTLPMFGMPAKLSCEIAVWGLIIGELASNIFNLISLYLARKNFRESHARYTKKILKLAIPLSSTRLVISILNSLEAVLIPAMLIQYGMPARQAISIYGILSGMVLPFLLFPGAITNSLSVLLLPAISNAYGRNDRRKIKVTSQIAIKYTLLLGLLSTFVFSMFGKNLGALIYQNETAGNYLFIMSALCPFIYCSTTLSSIINGLGKTHITFRNTVIGLAVRIAFLSLLTPRIGIFGYLLGLFLSQILITILDGQYLYRMSNFHLQIFHWFIFPSLFLWLIGFFLKEGMAHIFAWSGGNPNLLQILLIPIISGLFLFFLYRTGTIQKSEF